MSSEKIYNPIDTLIKDADSFFYGDNHWQAGLIQLVKELDHSQALWKPSGDRHCIWEIVKHINFWKRSAINYVLDKERPDSVMGNWTEAGNDATADDWKDELELTEHLHEELKQVLMKLGTGIYDHGERKSNYVRTILYHDCYHAGQIGFLRVMQGLKPVE